MKSAQAGHIAAYQGRRSKFRELGNGELFRMIAYGRAGIEYARALGLRIFEQMRGVDVFHIEGWIFAHKDRRELGQNRVLAGAAFATSRVARSAERRVGKEGVR